MQQLCSTTQDQWQVLLNCLASRPIHVSLAVNLVHQPPKLSRTNWCWRHWLLRWAGRKSLPTWGGGVESLRPWLRQLSYWEVDNNVPRARWGMKLLQSFAENSVPRKIAESLDLSVVLSEAGYGAILTEIMTKYGPYLEAIGPAAIDQFFYGMERSRNDSFSNYIASKELALQELEAQLGEKVPPRIAGRVLLRGANLTEPQRENLAIKYHALLTFDQVARALRPLDRPEALVGKVNKTFLLQQENAEETPSAVLPEDEDDELIEDNEEEPESDGDGNLTYLLFDQDREYTEEETQYIWAYNSAYRDVRKDLQARKKGRHFFKPKESKNKKGDGRGFKGKGKGGRGNRKNKGTPGDLLAKTRCFRCDELGHLSRDCPKRESQSFFVAHGGQGSINRTFFGFGNSDVDYDTKPESVMICSEQCEEPCFCEQDAALPISERCGEMLNNKGVLSNSVFVNIAEQLQKTISAFAGVRVDGHEAIVDTAAEEAVIGSGAFARLRSSLENLGLQPVSAAGATVSCPGIGGSAKIAGVWDIPIGVARTNGLIRVTEVEDHGTFETPFLLPISYQELVGASILLDQGIFKLRNGHKTQMRRTPSGHRAISILEFGGKWMLPESLKSDLKMGDDNPFLLSRDKKSNSVQQRPGVAVWLKNENDMVFMGALTGPRTTFVDPHEIFSSSQLDQLTKFRHTTAHFSDNHTMQIQDVWHTSVDRQLPLWSGDVVFERFSSFSSSLWPSMTRSQTPQDAQTSSIGVQQVRSPSPQRYCLHSAERLSKQFCISQSMSKKLKQNESKTSVTSWLERSFHSLQAQSARAKSTSSQSVVPCNASSHHEMGALGGQRASGNEQSNQQWQQVQTVKGAASGSLETIRDGHLEHDQPSSPRDCDGASHESSCTRDSSRAGREDPREGPRKAMGQEPSQDPKRHWSPSIAINRMQDMAVRAFAMLTRARQTEAESRPRTTLVDMLKLRIPMGSFGGCCRRNLELGKWGKLKFNAAANSNHRSDDHIISAVSQRTPRAKVPPRSQFLGAGRSQDSSAWNQGGPQEVHHGCESTTSSTAESRAESPRLARVPGEGESCQGEQEKEHAEWSETHAGKTEATDTSIPGIDGAVRDPLHQQRRCDRSVHFQQPKQPDFAGHDTSTRGVSTKGMKDQEAQKSSASTNKTKTMRFQSSEKKPARAAAVLSVLVFTSVFHSVATQTFLSSLGTMASPSDQQDSAVESSLFTPQSIQLTTSSCELGCTDFEGTMKVMNKSDRTILASSLSNYLDHCAEIYSPPRIVPEAKRAGLKARLSMDIHTGYDFRKPEDVKRSWDELEKWKPAVVTICPPCRVFSPLRNLSRFKRDPKRVQEEESEGIAFLEHAIDVIWYQVKNGRGFVFEHPWSSWAWEHPRFVELLQRSDIFMVRADMCAFGLKVMKGPMKGMLAQKPTGLVSNVPEVLELVDQKCTKDHRHGKLIGGVAHHAAIYTPQFIKAVVQGIKESLGLPIQSQDKNEPGRSSGRAIGAVLHAFAKTNNEIESDLFGDESGGRTECLTVGLGGSHPTTGHPPMKSTAQSSQSSSTLANSSSLQRLKKWSSMTSSQSSSTAKRWGESKGVQCGH